MFLTGPQGQAGNGLGANNGPANNGDRLAQTGAAAGLAGLLGGGLLLLIGGLGLTLRRRRS